MQSSNPTARLASTLRHLFGSAQQVNSSRDAPEHGQLEDVALGEHLFHTSLEAIIAQHGGTAETAPWSHTIVRSEHLFVTAICHNPGQFNDDHVHDYDEWWFVMRGGISHMRGVKSFYPYLKVPPPEFFISDSPYKRTHGDMIMSLASKWLGEIDWKMEGVGVVAAAEGDFVFAPALKFHEISPKTPGSN